MGCCVPTYRNVSDGWKEMYRSISASCEEETHIPVSDMTQICVGLILLTCMCLTAQTVPTDEYVFDGPLGRGLGVVKQIEDVVT